MRRPSQTACGAQIASILFFILFVGTMSVPALAEEYGLWWEIAIKSNETLLIRVNTEEMNSSSYLAAARCEVQFLDVDDEVLGTKTYEFPVPLESGEEKLEEFAHNYRGASGVTGIMSYKIQWYGVSASHSSKFDGEIPARQGKTEDERR